MNAHKAVLPLALGLALVIAPLATANATDTKPTRPAIVTTQAASGPKLTAGRTVKKSPKRNSEEYASARPMWVQLPVVVRSGGKYALRASVSVRAHRRAGAHSKSVKDKLNLTIAVQKPGTTTASAVRTKFLKTAHLQVSKHGLVNIKIPLSKKAAAQLAALQQAGDRVKVSFTHAKDTYPSKSKEMDFQQVLTGFMTTKVLTGKQVTKKARANVAAQKRIEAGKSPVAASGVRASNLNELYYTSLFVNNNTPFTQSVMVNPGINCMNVPPESGTMTAIVPAFNGSTQFVTGTDGGALYDQWYGQVKGNPYGSTPNYVQALADAGREPLNDLEDSFLDPETYSMKGLLTAGLSAAAEVGIDLLVKFLQEGNGCADYGQYWGVTATALYVGTPSAPNKVFGNPASWATGSFFTPGKGVTSVQIGQPVNQPSSLPAVGSSGWAAMSTMLNAAVGQQTQTTFMHNAGMPAPIANAGGNSAFNGNASFSQGLVQYIYPNPGSCANNNCNTGTTAVQLGYLLDNFDGPVGPQMTQLPTVTVTPGPTDGNTGQSVTELNCQIPDNGTFVNPFAGSQGAPGASLAPALNSLSQMQGVKNALFVVAYFAQDANGNYLYNSATTTSATYPGPLAGNTAYGAATYPPTLSTSENSLQLLGMNQAQNATQLSLSQSDLDSLINPTTGKPATATQFGCVVIPLVQWEAMNVTSGSVWGGNWPYPQQQSGGWLSSPWDNGFNWPAPVNAINLTWTGDPYLSGLVPAPPIYNPPTTSDRLTLGTTLNPNGMIVSQNGRYSVVQQTDGNLVALDGTAVMWSSGSYGCPGSWTIMQGDGNLVTYFPSANNKVVWASGTNGKGAAYAIIQNDGNFVIYSTSGAVLWASNTAGQ